MLELGMDCVWNRTGTEGKSPLNKFTVPTLPPVQPFNIFKISHLGIIANFVFPYLQFSSLFGVYDVSKCEVRCQVVRGFGFIFQGCRLYWSFKFWMVQPKWNWQCWHSCIVERLWKTLLLEMNWPSAVHSSARTFITMLFRVCINS